MLLRPHPRLLSWRRGEEDKLEASLLQERGWGEVAGRKHCHQNSSRVRKKSEMRMAMLATTTAAVVERPTPSAPPVV